MSEEKVKQRFRYAKKKTYSNLLNVYELVIPTPEPTHFFCPKSNIFIRIEIDEISDKTKRSLSDFKKKCSKDIVIQIHLFRKNVYNPELIEVEKE